MKWAYGVTTVLERRNTLLPDTLESLKAAGFDEPRLFVDGADSATAKEYEEQFKLPVTAHYPRLKAFGNWITALWELRVRMPDADRYAIFQDDIICCHNLRDYLTRTKYPAKGYQNLYTFPEHNRAMSSEPGWFQVKRTGLGALGLVFSAHVVEKLLVQHDLVMKPSDSRMPHIRIDGIVTDVLKRIGYYEHVHNPSLLQHAGRLASSIGNKRHPLAPTFPGPEFDAMSLTRTKQRADNGRICLVGHNTDTEIGKFNWLLATHLEVDRWIVHPYSGAKNRDPHPDVDTVFCKTGERRKMEMIFRTVDVVLFVDRPYFRDIIPLAQRHKKRIVCIPYSEFTKRDRWTQFVDLFICRSNESFEELKGEFPCALVHDALDEPALVEIGSELTEVIRTGQKNEVLQKS